MHNLMPTTLFEKVTAKHALGWPAERICDEYDVPPKYVAVAVLLIEAIHVEEHGRIKALEFELASTLRSYRRLVSR